MIPIHKNSEPYELARYKQVTDEQHWDYDALGQGIKPAIQRSLCTEQGYICAYCMQRIEANGTSMRIEHWLPQASSRIQSVDYSNMLGCCRGEHRTMEDDEDSNDNGVEYHCDTFRGQITPPDGQQLKYNPANPDHYALLKIYYNFVTGEVHSHDEGFDKQLSEVLNLNNSYLCEKRKNVIAGPMEELLLGGTAKSIADNWRQRDDEGKYEEFFDVVVQYLSP